MAVSLLCQPDAGKHCEGFVLIKSGEQERKWESTATISTPTHNEKCKIDIVTTSPLDDKSQGVYLADRHAMLAAGLSEEGCFLPAALRGCQRPPSGTIHLGPELTLPSSLWRHDWRHRAPEG